MFDQLKARFMAWPPAARIAAPILAAVIVLCAVPALCCSALNAGSGSTTPRAASSSTSAPGGATSTPKATKAQPTATPKPAAKSVLKLSGSGTKTSATFHVDGQWKIVFHCDNTSSLETVPFFISIYNSDGSTTFDTVTYDCPKSGGGDESVIHDGGDKYLKVAAMSPWSLEVVDIP